MAKNELMDRWCTRQWIFFGLCITFVMTAVILWKWKEWNAELIITAAIAALIPIHVVEEWVFPGGFHYQYNYCMGSDQLDRYPMCRKSDMFTNLIATFMYIGFTVYAVCNDGIVPTGIVVGTIGFCALEVIIHTYFGVMMYRKFHSVGKQTIYGPGSLTAYLCFGAWGVILYYGVNWNQLTGGDWLLATAVVLIGVGLLSVLLPESLIKKRDNDYFFHSAGYFERFIN